MFEDAICCLGNSVVLFIRAVSEKFLCDKCKEEVDFEDVAYLGSGFEECSPFMELDCFCRECYEENE